MAAPISRPVGIVSCAHALCGGLFIVLCGVAAPGPASAAECLTAPSASAPADGHWYYRTDRAQQRKCWFLRTGSEQVARGAAAANEVPADKDTPATAAGPNSLASFKEFITQRRGTTPSDRDVEQLYAEFLQWNRRAKN